MKTPIKPHLYLAAVDTDLVILDIVAGDYGCVLNAGVGLGADRRLLETHDCGLRDLLCNSPDEVRPARFLKPLPLSPKGSFQRPRWEGDQGASFGLCAAWMVAIFPLMSFEALIVGAERAGRNKSEDHDGAERCTGTFLAGVPALPAQGECLYRCRLLLGLLHAHGHTADWVFGVRLWPFRAHCWLQVGDMVLADDPDHISQYEPILIV